MLHEFIFTAPVATITQAENKIAVEGTNVEVYCNATGIPDPAVIWRNVKSGKIIDGNLLSFTDITRAQAGEYKCTANNTCGKDSTMVNIDVQCKKRTNTLFMLLFRGDLMVILLLNISVHKNVT